jgi:glycosyltransferase involved in cell wall biosynthesis
MANPVISVVITTYNKAAYIEKTLTSVLEQTFRDFEVIVVDDGSTDGTVEILKMFTDPRLTCVFQANTGLPACGRNTGMALARGTYIALLDGDDYWASNKLEQCLRAFEAHPDVDLVCHNEFIMYQNAVLRTTSYGPYTPDMYLRLLIEGNGLHVSAVMLRAAIIHRDHVEFSCDPRLCAIEDYEYWLRLARKYRFHFITEPLGYYLVTDSGIFLTTSEDNTVYLLELVDKLFAALEPELRLRYQRRLCKRKSLIMSAAGRMFLHKKSFKNSRRWYTKAVHEYPFNSRALVGLIASIFKLRILYF